MQSFALTDVPLIPQDKNKACWYASAQMVITWRRSRTRSCELSHPDPFDVPKLVDTYKRNQGLPFEKTTELAKALGLKELPPSCPSPGYVATLLKEYGPLWFAGLHPYGHAVVITGISPAVVNINDPWPVGTGAIRDITLNQFHQINQPLKENMPFWQAWFTPAKLTANFLYCPK